MLNNLLAALKAGSWAPALNSLITVAVTIGVLTTEQAGAIADVVTGIASLVSIIVAAAHLFRGTRLIVAQQGRDGAYRITSKE